MPGCKRRPPGRSPRRGAQKEIPPGKLARGAARREGVRTCRVRFRRWGLCLVLGPGRGTNGSREESPKEERDPEHLDHDAACGEGPGAQPHRAHSPGADPAPGPSGLSRSGSCLQLQGAAWEQARTGGPDRRRPPLSSPQPAHRKCTRGRRSRAPSCPEPEASKAHFRRAGPVPALAPPTESRPPLPPANDAGPSHQEDPPSPREFESVPVFPRCGPTSLR